MLFLLCFLLFASVCHGARVTLLSGTSLNGPIATNSVLTDISLEDGMAVSCSQTDSQISLAPFDEDWAAVDEGTLVGDLTVVSGASNIVSSHRDKVRMDERHSPSDDTGRRGRVIPPCFVEHRHGSLSDPVEDEEHGNEPRTDTDGLR